MNCSPFPDQLPCDSTGDSTRVSNEVADRFIRALSSLQSPRHSPTDPCMRQPTNGQQASHPMDIRSQIPARYRRKVLSRHKALAGLRRDQLKRVGSLVAIRRLSHTWIRRRVAQRLPTRSFAGVGAAALKEKPYRGLSFRAAVNDPPPR